MIKFLTYLAILACAFTVFTYPYFAALFYSFVSILQPQYIWHWVFGDLPIYKITAGMAIIGWGTAILRGNVNWSVYRSGIVYAMFGLLLLFHLSDLLSPFQSYVSAVSSDLVIGIFTTIVIMFVVVIGAINSEKALKYAVYVLLAAVMYYTYWANSAYFGGEWWRFSNGRLGGPIGSPYADGNAASVMFVIAMPFIVLALYEIKKVWLKAAIMVAMIFILHAIILFASRGALLSIGVSMLLVAMIVKSRAFNFVLALGIVVFLIDQGGQLMSRTSTTIQIAQQNNAEPINPRLVSWQVGFELTKKHPILGVGPQRFLEASRSYFPGKSPHVAHNTFLNFAANTGLIAGFLYLSFFWITLKNYRTNRTILERAPNRLLNYVNRASYISMAGFFTAAIFLDLIIFEPFYFLLVIVVTTHHLTNQHGVAHAAKH